VSDVPPCVLFEDEHLLVVNKPSGLNTHAPSPYAGEGLYDWLRHREPRWERLAIVQRLDKDTSGVLLFPKTPLASRSLTKQFAARAVRKKYLLVTDRPIAHEQLTVRSSLVRLGDRYVSRPKIAGNLAETRFRVIHRESSGRVVVEAEPLTGRTHQIRVHAADSGFPVLGDVLYGGAAFPRLCLHSAELRLRHPVTHNELIFKAAPTFDLDPILGLRQALINPDATDSCRLVHGAADRWPGLYIDRLGDIALCASEFGLTQNQSDARALPLDTRSALAACMRQWQLKGVYFKRLMRHPGRPSLQSSSPSHLMGQGAPDELIVRENGVRFALSFKAGYSIGLFLDQRDNRRRLLINHIAAGFPACARGLEQARILNTFAYTCSFSVCAARAGAHTTSLDLSRKYLEWGRRNFRLNSLDPARHEFICGDAFDWMRHLTKKQRSFDLIILDPPSFSRSKQYGAFQVEKDCPALVALALPLLKPDGVLLVSANLAQLMPEAFLDLIIGPISAAKRRIIRQHYAPQPPDFPINRDEPGYLKTVWMRLA
jgi:23S rRNA (cytosine1962-C5)-methyltransferase